MVIDYLEPFDVHAPKEKVPCRFPFDFPDGSLENVVFEDGTSVRLASPRLPIVPVGTGDLFTSVVVCGLMRGFDLRASVDSAARFVYDCMEYGRGIEDIFDRGVAFEPLVHKLASGIYVE